jgi:multiple sugar transport system permease protein
MAKQIAEIQGSTVWQGAQRGRWTTIRKQLPNYLFILPFLVGFFTFTIYPIGFGAYMSLHEWDILGRNPPYVGLENYRSLMSDRLWWLTLRQTIQYAIQTVFSVVTLGLIAALITFQSFRGRSLLRVIYYFPATLSVAIVALSWQWLLDTHYGLINYVLSFVGIGKIRWLQDPMMMLPSLTLAAMWGDFGFPMLIFLAGLSDIPQSLYEAAKVDGANPWQSFWRITLPLLRPTLLFIFVTQFIGRLQEFGMPYVMVGLTTMYTGASGFHHWTVIVYLYQTAWQWWRMGYGSAMAFALAAVIIAITLIQFRILGRRLQY